ncbi:MAG: aldo/keto reductase [Elusimicrobia bacterium]|nr:aldo/keto reductase [Elusimicrobiota bacterium]
MRYRPFGKTGLEVSEIGFGAWGIGGSMWGKTVDDASSVNALHRALDLRINFFDTALAYGMGHSEQLIGQVLKERAEDVFIATKVPPKNWKWPASHAVPVKEVFPENWIVECAEKSLRNLGVERLDLLQFHVWSDTWMDQDGWWDAVDKLKKDGKVRLWGVSINNHEPDSALRLAGSGKADSVQVIYNIFDPSPAEALFPLCREKGVAVIVRVPFDEGGLTGAFTRETKFEEGDFRRDYFSGRLADVVERVEKLKPLLLKEAGSLPEAALKFCLSHPAVSTVIPGMRKAEHVEANVRASDGKTLSCETLDRLKEHAWPRDFYRSR